jgi:hypothetical protein
MGEKPPDDDPRHDAFRDLCMKYGDFNRSVFLEEILNSIAGFGATAAELSAIRTAVQKRTKKLAKRSQRGRPRAEQSEAWMQSALTAAYRKRVLGWSWSRVTESAGMKPTKPNIRTVQRRERQYAELTLDAVAPLNIWEPGQLRRKLRDGVLDSKRVQLQLKSKTGLPFDTRPEECKKLVEALLR